MVAQPQPRRATVLADLWDQPPRLRGLETPRPPGLHGPLVPQQPLSPGRVNHSQWSRALLCLYGSNFCLSDLECFTLTQARCLPMILSTFSHYGAFHLLLNMLALHSFIGPTVDLLGPEQFLGFYLSAGVVSSLVSMTYKVATRSAGLSLGASGAIYGVVGMFATLQPDAKLQIIFQDMINWVFSKVGIILPTITFPASLGIGMLVVADTAGLLRRWRYLDHAGHLGGMLYGVFWAYYGSDSIWARREGLVTAWHNLRTK